MAITVKAIPRAIANGPNDEAVALDSKLNQWAVEGRLVQVVESGADGGYLLAIFQRDD